MSEQITIESVGQSRDFETAHGAFRSYRIIDQTGREVEWVRKPESPAPEPGLALEAEVVEGRFCPRLKNVHVLGATPSGSGGETQSSGQTPAPSSYDDRQDRISAQWAIGRAVELEAATARNDRDVDPERIKRRATAFLGMASELSSHGGGVSGASSEPPKENRSPLSPAETQRLKDKIQNTAVFEKDVLTFLFQLGVSGHPSVNSALATLNHEQAQAVDKWLDGLGQFEAVAS